MSATGMDTNRKAWNQRQQQLQDILPYLDKYHQAIELFLSQHAMVHAEAMSGSGLWSFEDAVWDGLTEPLIRRIPYNGEHSIAWVLWHIARIEDVTMNLLVAGSPQVFDEGAWRERINAPIRHTGNSMSEAEIVHLSSVVEIDALRAYRIAVGRRTREIAQQLRPEALKQKVEPSRLRRVREQGAVIEAASEIIDYWGGRTIAGLLLMPATRHNFIHLNEAIRLKHKRR